MNVRHLGVFLTPQLHAIYTMMRDQGNLVVLAFKKVENVEAVSKKFTVTTTGVANPEMVEAFKTMPKGQALQLPLDHGLKSDRSLKRQVNAAAKEANREIDWSKAEDGWYARVVAIIGQNGQVAATTEDDSEENGEGENGEENNGEGESEGEPASATRRRR